MFKNSLKLLIANFSTVWKLILYYIIVIGIVIGLVAPFFGVIGQTLNTDGTLSALAELLTSFNVSVNIFVFFADFFILLSALATYIITLFVSHTWVAIYLTVLLLYITPFLFGLAELAVGQSLFGYMSSLTKYGFVGSFVRMLKRSLRFQLFKNLVYLPINIIIIAVLLAILKLTTFGGLVLYFVPFMLVVALVGLVALKRTFFSGWMPAIVVYDCNMFVALGKGMKAVFRRFFRVLSTAVVIILLTVALNYLFGTLAFLVTIPLTMAFLYIFEMVMFYSSQGMKFYVDIDTILSSKLLEESDSFKKVKNII
jgi:hypothetical protein